MSHPLPSPNAVSISHAALRFGDRSLWDNFTLDIAPGEFVTVLGPNGSGKSSLLKCLLGEYTLDAGTAAVFGQPVRRGNQAIGYVPQHDSLSDGVTLRGRDLVGLGLDGQRWGIGLRDRKQRATLVDSALAQVNAHPIAHDPIGRLSGGERQRLRIAQALAGDPQLLLCDEPLLNLDPANQALVSSLIDQRRRSHHTAVVFVTHEINPVLPYTDRVVYLTDGRFRIGTPDQVMTTEVLSELYRTRVEVVHANGRLVVVGAEDMP